MLDKGFVAEIDAEAEQATTEQIARYAGERGAKLHSSRSNETRWVIHGSEATRRFSAHPAGLFAHGEARNQENLGS